MGFDSLFFLVLNGDSLWWMYLVLSLISLKVLDKMILFIKVSGDHLDMCFNKSRWLLLYGNF